MAKGSGSGKKCCLALLITVLVIIALLATAVVVLLNLTPNKIGIGDLDFGDNTTLNGLGLGDAKFITIIKELSAMSSADEAEMVTNPYDATAEQANASATLNNSTVSENYSLLFENKAVYALPKVVSYNDTTLAYILQAAIDAGKQSQTSYAKDLADSNMSVKQVTIKKISDTQGMLEVVGAIDVKAMFNAESDNAATQSVQSLISNYEYIYVTVQAIFEVAGTGVNQGNMQGTATSITINGQGEDNAVAQAILTYAANKLSEEGEEVDFKQLIVDATTSVINNLGKIGTAQADAEGVAVLPNYGMVGVQDGKLSMITYTVVG